MPQIYLARHGQSTVNVGDIAFGNKSAPLTVVGMGQTSELRNGFMEVGITPESYDMPVLASDYVRARDTARATGFTVIDQSSIVNEANLEGDISQGLQVIKKHSKTGWVPEETYVRAQHFISLIREGMLGYEVYFTHGMFIASVLTVLEDDRHTLDADRGFIPLQASLTVVDI